MQSFGGHAVVSWASEAFRYLTSEIRAQDFRITLDTRLLIGIGLVATAALYARRPLGA